MNSQHTEQGTQAVITGCDLSKTFVDGASRVEVLKSVNIEVFPGEMAAIIGASGSGKSTLLHVLGGLDAPDHGHVLINGQDIHQVNVTQQGIIRNQSLGFVYQFHHLLAEFTALENVAMPLLIGGYDKDAAFKQAESMIAKVGLANRATHRPAKLSGGERQRIAIARAMVTKPACILADEPTGNLDMATAQSINELMQSLSSEEGTAFLVVSHDLRLAESMNVTYQMQDGELEKVNS